MNVDSLVLRQMEGHPRLYWCRAVRDSVLRADVAALGGDYMLEYILDGEYRTFRASDGGEPKEFVALTQYLWGLYRARHE